MKCTKQFGLHSSVLLLALAWSYPAAAQWIGTDVGGPTPAGSFTNNSDGTITLKGGGGDIWGTADQMFYYYKNVTGDWWDAVVKVNSLDGASSTWAKAELMARLDDGSGAPNANDAFIAGMTTPANGQNEIADQFRGTGGASAAMMRNGTWRPSYPNQWLRLQRIGSVFSVYFGNDNKTWNRYFSVDTTSASGTDTDDTIDWSFSGPWANHVLVGVALTSHAQGTITTSVISGLAVTPHTAATPSALAVAKQIQAAVTNYAYSGVTFSFSATNNGGPAEYYPNLYQWYKNNQLVTSATVTNSSDAIGNVVSTPQNYTFLPTPADDGAQVYCKVTTPGYPMSIYSATGLVAVLSSTSYTNGVKVERFMGTLRADVENYLTGPADSVRVSSTDASAMPLNYTGFESIINDNINNFTERLSGWFIPPTTDKYVFFLCSDDDSDLFLSTDNTPANKILIAQENAWSNSREWTNSSGSSQLSQKRSDQWLNESGTAPFADGIALTAGTPYYIEAVHHQGSGGDNLGVLAQIVGSTDPTNGAPPIPSSQLVLASHPATKLTWVNQPAPTMSVFEGGSPIFAGNATSDSEFLVLYQWQRSGTNIPGATTTGYSFVTTAADNGAQFALVAATAEGGLSITAPVTLTVQQAAFEKGLALMQYRTHQSAASPEGTLPLGAPIFQMAVPAFEAGVNNENGGNYVNSVSGFFIPAVSGTYDFIVTGDDNIDLFLSTDANPNNKRLICQEPGWSNQLTWSTDDGGGNGVPQKHSATWTNADSAGVAPFANGFSLTAGNKYYIEMWHHEGGGGDSCAATFTMRTGGVIAPDPANGTDSAITGNLLGFNTPAAHYMQFTLQPTNTTTVSGNAVSFSANGTSDGQLPVGVTGLFQTVSGLEGADPTNFVQFPTVLFQWYKNGTAIAGATTPTYTTPPLKPSDDKAQYVAGIRALGYASWSNSTPAQVTVIADTVKPVVYSAVFDENGLPVITVSFSKTMDMATITNLAHYSVTGGGASVYDIVVDTNDARHVQLKLASALTGPATLTLTGITDFSGNTPVTSTLNVVPSKLTSIDISDPMAALGQAGFMGFPGYAYADGAGAWSVACEGSDIWDAADAFHFTYEIKTNDFDVVVRHVSFTKVSNWSKGGLMAREDLTPQSRDWNVVNDPTSADGVGAIDGSGTGANIVESNCRTTNGMASLGWALSGTGTVPAYPNAWVRLKRTGQVLQSFWSSNGVQWVQQGLDDVSTNSNGPLPANLYVGICATAHANDDYSATAVRYIYRASFADYNSAFVAPTNTPQARVSASIAAGNVVISWTPAGGTLQSTTALGTTANWAPVGTANPATLPISGGAKFFRVVP